MWTRPSAPTFPIWQTIDYLTFGGIYREVAIRVVPLTFIENIFAKPTDVLAEHPRVEVDCHLQGVTDPHEALALRVELHDGERSIGAKEIKIASRSAVQTVVLESFGPVKLWDLAKPHLYTVHVRLTTGKEIGEDSRRLGFSPGAVYRSRICPQRQSH